MRSCCSDFKFRAHSLGNYYETWERNCVTPKRTIVPKTRDWLKGHYDWVIRLREECEGRKGEQCLIDLLGMWVGD